jgi:hypothetical protein
MSNQVSNSQVSCDEAPAATTLPPLSAVGKVGTVVLTLLAVIACLGFSYWLRRPGPELTPTPETQRTRLKLPANRMLFNGWEKPDFVLVLSAEGHGYLLPCGCSRPQKGGLERRYNFIQILRDKGWPVVAVDLGDVAQAEVPGKILPNLQQLIKYEYTMKALKAMDYTAVGIGPIEANNLFQIYGQYALNEDKPRVLSANLHNRSTDYYLAKEQRGIFDWAETTAPGTDIKVGVTSIMGAFLAEKRPKSDQVQFDFGGAALKALQNGARQGDFRVLLYEGYKNVGHQNKSEAKACAEKFPEYNVILALSDATDDEPSANPDPVKHGNSESIVVTLGHKSKYIGVVGVYKTGKKNAPFRMRYQLVEMGEEYMTPAEEEKDHPIVKLMEDYTAQLKSDDYLAKYPQQKHPLQVIHPGKNKPEFAGSDACKQCHAGAFKKWTTSDHAKAYQTLVGVKRPLGPKNREFDPECIVCHTVGFGYETGFENAKKTNFLKDVGCENCHGPCSAHIDAELAASADIKAWRKAINPWKYLPTKADHRKAMAQMCIKCHDLENDVNWAGQTSFDERWDKIKHYSAPKAAPAPPMK